MLTMKVAVAVFAACMVATVSGFAAPAFTRGTVSTRLYSEPEKKDGESSDSGGLDLDLGEMFEMFDAADKEESFDDAVKKVKGKKEEEKSK